MAMQTPPIPLMAIMLFSMRVVTIVSDMNAMAANMVSQVAAPSPEKSPDRKPLLKVRCMHNMPTGPGGVDAKNPTKKPPMNTVNHISRKY